MGFRERGYGGDWGGGHRGCRWRERDRDQLLDDILERRAQDNEDQRAGIERRAEAGRAIQKDYDDRINAINGRFSGYLDEYARNISGPICDGRLDTLRVEEAVYKDRQRQREEDQADRDRLRAREMKDAAKGRDVRHDFEDHGFTMFGRPRW